MCINLVEETTAEYNSGLRRYINIFVVLMLLVVSLHFLRSENTLGLLTTGFFRTWDKQIVTVTIVAKHIQNMQVSVEG
jgi:hypothetical protein